MAAVIVNGEKVPIDKYIPKNYKPHEIEVRRARRIVGTIKWGSIGVGVIGLFVVLSLLPGTVLIPILWIVGIIGGIWFLLWFSFWFSQQVEIVNLGKRNGTRDD